MKDKKITLVFILIAVFSLLGMIGFTIAYFTSSVDFENEFEAATYQIDTEEIFTSPTNWLPGDTTQKELTIQNTGNIDVKARVCPEEEWISDNGDNLPLEQNGNRVAIINLANTNDWTKKGRCYYYNDTLEPNDIASSFMSSVTFNEETMPDLVCTSNTVNGVTTRNCNSSGDGYDNATYILTLHVETVQADKASEEWDPILFVNRQTDGEINVGDEITIKGENFYVVSSDEDKTVLLSKYKIKVGDTIRETISLPNRYYNETHYSETYPKQFNEIDYSSSSNNYYLARVPFSDTNYWDSCTAYYEGNAFHSSCAYMGGLLNTYAVNGASYSGNIKPYVYKSDSSCFVAPDILYTNGGAGSVMTQRNGYTICYYVEKYISTLKELTLDELTSITGRLLSYEEAIGLGCTSSSCNPSQSSAPAWLSNENFYLGSAYSAEMIWSIKTTGYLGAADFVRYKMASLRPVIEIPTSAMPQ